MVFEFIGPTMVRVRKTSIFGEVVSHDIPVRNPLAFMAGVSAWLNGVSVQDAFPFMAVADREFLISGITPEKWNEIFSGSEDSEDNILMEVVDEN